jgi:hypothetical protein
MRQGGCELQDVGRSLHRDTVSHGLKADDRGIGVGDEFAQKVLGGDDFVRRFQAFVDSCRDLAGCPERSKSEREEQAQNGHGDEELQQRKTGF